MSKNHQPGKVTWHDDQRTKGDCCPRLVVVLVVIFVTRGVVIVFHPHTPLSSAFTIAAPRNAQVDRLAMLQIIIVAL